MQRAERAPPAERGGWGGGQYPHLSRPHPACFANRPPPFRGKVRRPGLSSLTERETYAAYQATVPRRSCRSLLRSGPLKEARASAKRRDHRRTVEAIEDREIAAIISSRRRWAESITTASTAGRSELRLSGQARRRRGLSRRAQDQVSGQAAEAEMLRVVGKLGSYSPHPMGSSISSTSRRIPADAEDDDPVAVVAALSLWPLGRAGSIYPAMADFYRDLGQSYRRRCGLRRRRCRYLQLDR